MDKALDLRVQKTYNALNKAFTELIEEHRFEEFTVNELCEKAMIRRTTFYKHFADKLDYFDFYLKEMAKAFKEELKNNELNKDINQYFLMMCRKLIEFLSEHRAMINSVVESNMYPLLLDILIDTIRTDLITVYKKQSNNKTDLRDFELKASFYAGGLLSMLYEWLKKEKEIDADKFIDTISTFL